MKFKLVGYFYDNVKFETNDINRLIQVVRNACPFAVRGDGEKHSYRGAYNSCKALLNGSEKKVFMYAQKFNVDPINLLYITVE